MYIVLPNKQQLVLSEPVTDPVVQSVWRRTIDIVLKKVDEWNDKTSGVAFMGLFIWDELAQIGGLAHLGEIFITWEPYEQLLYLFNSY